MEIISVSARNFRSYKHLDWKLQKSGIYLIDGRNVDTGRSNMTGKTTLLDAIFWGLYGYLPKWDGPKGGPADAVIFRGQKSCTVSVTVRHNGDVFQITRRRPTDLSVAQNQVDIPGKKGDLDTRIPGLIGMNAEQFLLSVYISQNRKKSFFSMSDGERTKLLSTVAGLDDLNRALEKTKEQKAILEAQKTSIQGSLFAVQRQLDRFPEEKNSLYSDLARSRGFLSILMDGVNEASGKCSALLTNAKADLESKVSQAEAEHESAVSALNAEYSVLFGERIQKQAEIKNAPIVEPELEIELSQAKTALDQAKASNLESLKVEVANNTDRIRLGHIAEAMQKGENLEACEECNRPFPIEDMPAYLEKLYNRAKEIEGRIQPELPKIDLKPLESNLAQAEEKLLRRKIEVEARPESLRREVKALDAQLASLKKQQEMLLTQLTLSKNMANSVYQQAVTAAEALVTKALSDQANGTTEAQGLENSIKLLKSRESVCKADNAKLELALAQNSKEYDEVLDLMDLFGPKGLRAVCFDGLIGRISDRASELLQLMTDHVYATRIDQVGETAKGEERLILKPTITKGGVDVPVDDLSGGALKMATLGYDVAVSEAVGESSVLFLDEALDGLDSIGKAEAMRLLEEVSRTRAVYIIDHASEFKAACQEVLEIVYENGVSRMGSENTESEAVDAVGGV